MLRAVKVIFALALLMICANVQEAVSQESKLDQEISRYEADISQRPDDVRAYEKLGIAYAKKGFFDKAADQFEEAMKIRYKEGYEAGRKDAAKRIYGRYLILSMAAGLFISAIIVYILLWSEMSDRIRDIRKNTRIRAFTRNIKVQLSPELRDRADGIARRKETLRDAITRESDASLREAALSVLPKLDDLSRQAALLLELQQNLSDYVMEIDPAKLETARSKCEEKLKSEADEEVRRALQYQLKQVQNKQMNYSKAQARIRTCDAVLSGIAARIDATSLALMSLPSVLIRKQEFFEKVSTELDEEINLSRYAAETVMDESE